MKSIWKSRFTVVCLVCLCAVGISLMGVSGVQAAMPAFDFSKMSDMSGFDPSSFENPTGDVVKIGVVEAFSGPGAFNGQIYWMVNSWVAYDYNKRGGVMVDGKKKQIAVIKGDSQGKPAICKKITEKLCLEDKVDLIFGTAGSHLTLIVQQTAKKYKTVFMNTLSVSDAPHGCKKLQSLFIQNHPHHKIDRYGHGLFLFQTAGNKILYSESGLFFWT